LFHFNILRIKPSFSPSPAAHDRQYSKLPHRGRLSRIRLSVIELWNDWRTKNGRLAAPISKLDQRRFNLETALAQ